MSGKPLYSTIRWCQLLQSPLNNNKEYYPLITIPEDDGCFKALTVREDEGTTVEELEMGVKEVVGPLLQLSGEPGRGAEEVGVGKGAEPSGGRAKRRFRSSMYRSISWSNLDSISSTWKNKCKDTQVYQQKTKSWMSYTRYLVRNTILTLSSSAINPYKLIFVLGTHLCITRTDLSKLNNYKLLCIKLQQTT